MTRDYVAELRELQGPEPRAQLTPPPYVFRWQARPYRLELLTIAALTTFVLVGGVLLLALVYALGWLVGE